MFGYRVRYLGPEDDENEDICYAYRHVPQKDTENKLNQNNKPMSSASQ
jgi:hypothetical protein